MGPLVGLLVDLQVQQFLPPAHKVSHQEKPPKPKLPLQHRHQVFLQVMCYAIDDIELEFFSIFYIN